MGELNGFISFEQFNIVVNKFGRVSYKAEVVFQR